MTPLAACPTCGHKPRAKRAKRANVAGPSLYAGAYTFKQSTFAPNTPEAIRAGIVAREHIASWALHKAAGEYPVITDTSTNAVSWRKAA